MASQAIESSLSSGAYLLNLRNNIIIDFVPTVVLITIFLPMRCNEAKALIVRPRKLVLTVRLGDINHNDNDTQFRSNKDVSVLR